MIDPARVDRVTSPRELVLALVLGAVCVCLRSAVYVVYEQSFFDSDQAVLGLMAKHLVEGRALPLFYYGQPYLLAVDAWLAAPWFAVGGPSVSMLHASLVLTNIAAVSILIIALSRSDGLRPILALVAVLPFAFAPPATASYFLDAAASVAPFLYVGLIWLLRDRPIALGLVVAIGFLHREFTVYGVGALVAVDALNRRLRRAASLRAWVVVAVAAVATWQAVEALKPYADLMGPGTRGELIRGYAGSQIGNLTERADFAVQALPGRLWTMVTEHLPRLVGASASTSPVADQGHSWLRWPFLFALVLALAKRRRASFQKKKPDLFSEKTPGVFFSTYLALAGGIAAVAYVITRPAEDVVDRYLLLVLFLPIGLAARALAATGAAWARHAVVTVLLALAAGSALDHARVALGYRAGVPDDAKALADALVERKVPVAMAGYWRAYKLTFLAGERVKVASSDFVRIEEYQRLANEAGGALIMINDAPCDGGERVLGWYLCRAGD